MYTTVILMSLTRGTNDQHARVRCTGEHCTEQCVVLASKNRFFRLGHWTLSLYEVQLPVALLRGRCCGQCSLTRSSNKLDDGSECSFSKFGEHTKPGGSVNPLQGRAAVPGSLGRLENWAARNLVKCSRGKRQILHLGWDNPVRP